MRARRNITQVLYNLRDYSDTVSLVSKSSTTDYSTGEITPNDNAIDVKFTITMDGVNKDIYKALLNREFLYGGQYNKEVKSFIMDKRYLPTGYVIKVDQQIVYQGSYFSLVSIDKFEAGYFIVGQAVGGQT